MLQANHFQLRSLFVTAACVALALACAAAAFAQSGDANFPTPVFTNEVSGRIAPRDIGDPRRTSHFYTFRGTEGDLSVTFDSTELTGDVDVFTATTLRPLLKITLLGDAAHVTKSFYIRSQETLVLRVQARAVGDAEGTYHITFGGSFQPAPPELANSQQPTAPTVKETASRDRNAHPTTSTGARIEEPAAPKEEAKAEPTPTPAPSPTPARRTTSSAARGRAGARTAPRRTRTPASTAQPNAAKSETDEAKNSNGGANETGANTSAANSSGQPSSVTSGATNSNESSAATPKPATRRRPARTPRRSAGESGTSSARTESGAQPSNANTPAATEPLPKQRLLIITKSGSMIERDMDTVRRVTVENNQVVVITKDGKIIREPLANVLRMSIEP